MAKKLYIGNLPFSTNEDEVTELFSEHGTVESVILIRDRDTGRLRGFGFVEMDPAGADAARAALDGSEFGGRPLRVDEAREREPRRGGREARR